MVDELAKSIAQLRELSPKLNAASDAATALVKCVEDFLSDECSIGIEASVAVEATPSDVDPDKNVGLWLDYCRVGPRFRIAITRQDDETDPQDDTKYVESDTFSWSSAPREMKLKAFPKLPALLRAIAERAEEAIKANTETTATVEKIVAAMKK